MGKKLAKRDSNGQKAAPTTDQQKQAEALAKKKTFIKNLMKANQMVVFTGEARVSHWGFPSNGDFVLFLMQQVYDWDGKNPVCENIIKSLTAESQPATEDDLDGILDDLDETSSESSDEASSSDENSDQSVEVAPSAEVIPMTKKEAPVVNVEEDEITILKKRLAELERKAK